MKLFVFPTGGAAPDNLNPYVRNMKEALGKYFGLVQPRYKMKIPRMMVFLLSSFRADVYVFNWIEDSYSGRGGLLGAIISLLGLKILKLRKAKIVWIFHNLHSHNGDSYWTEKIRLFLFQNASFIVAHSREATEYAQRIARCPVFFKNHPIKVIKYANWAEPVHDNDFFYWGTIAPYKGVVEFLDNPICRQSKYSIYILGKCSNKDIDLKIRALENDNIVFDNRTASFEEIAANCRKSKYVIFPYIGDSISSSGVLMDTLLMGGTPVGPNRGAFADLAACGCCLTYNSIDEVFSLPIGKNDKKRLDPEKVKSFVEMNSWDGFALWMKTELQKVL